MICSSLFPPQLSLFCFFDSYSDTPSYLLHHLPPSSHLHNQLPPSFPPLPIPSISRLSLLTRPFRRPALSSGPSSTPLATEANTAPPPIMRKFSTSSLRGKQSEEERIHLSFREGRGERRWASRVKGATKGRTRSSLHRRTVKDRPFNAVFSRSPFPTCLHQRQGSSETLSATRWTSFRSRSTFLQVGS
jgi:hypothetical protein